MIEERNTCALGYAVDNLGRPNGRDAGVVKFGVWVDWEIVNNSECVRNAFLQDRSECKEL